MTALNLLVGILRRAAMWTNPNIAMKINETYRQECQASAPSKCEQAEAAPVGWVAAREEANAPLQRSEERATVANGSRVLSGRGRTECRKSSMNLASLLIVHGFSSMASASTERSDAMIGSGARAEGLAHAS